MKNIVLAIDFAGLTGAVLDLGATLADRFGATLWLVHIEPCPPDHFVQDGDPLTAVATNPHLQQLQAMAKELHIKNIRAKAMCWYGPAGPTLFENAGQAGADLIIIGAHAESPYLSMDGAAAIDRMVRGSTAPVLLVPESVP